MMKPITGQYECVRKSGVGLDYFTSRIDRLTIHPNGRFVLVVQDRSRAANAAQSLLGGQGVNAQATETQREGNYSQQSNILTLAFDDGMQVQGQLSWNGDGLQLAADYFTKVSDSTFLPPTERLQKNMEDIAKGIKIASTLGGMAANAVKTINETLQGTQGQVPNPAGQPPPAQLNQGPTPAPAAPQPQAPSYATPPPAQNFSQPPPTQSGEPVGLFCDQCGTRNRPGKRFCNNCGARLT